MKQKLDVNRLKENAITSIRLGIEDFQITQKEDGDKARALSSIRNLFSGVLLLFKYKIASLVDNPEDAEKLIFNPPPIEPKPDGDGGFSWQPNGNFKSTTINVGMIKNRFDSFGVEVDWKSIYRIQDCRNDLEHLHPENTLGEVAEFVSDLFPILKDFIERELDSKPHELLGDSWVPMLKHHEMFMKAKKECDEQWEDVHMPELLRPLTPELRCSRCHANLIFPDKNQIDNDLRLDGDENDFLCHCLACGAQQLILDAINDRIESINYSSRRYGDSPEFETCFSCDKDMFSTIENICFWCEDELEFTECSLCSEPLSQDDQLNNGLCSYHNNAYERIMRE